MDAYTFTLALGGLGLLIMAVSGFGHRLHPGQGPGRGAHPGAHGHHGHAVAKAGGKAPATPSAHGIHASVAKVSRAFLTILSPRVAFSLLVGFGATGFILKSWLGGPVLIAIAAAGGVFFESVLVRPLFNLLSRFASDPALTLESTLGDEVRVVSGFDAQGQGLVALEVDGQIVQLLGTLIPGDRGGARVRAGETLYVREVDAERHRVVVARTPE